MRHIPPLLYLTTVSQAGCAGSRSWLEKHIHNSQVVWDGPLQYRYLNHVLLFPAHLVRGKEAREEKGWCTVIRPQYSAIACFSRAALLSPTMLLRLGCDYSIIYQCTTVQELLFSFVVSLCRPFPTCSLAELHSQCTCVCSSCVNTSIILALKWQAVMWKKGRVER